MEIDRAVTTVQLERRGLLETVQRMGLTTVERTCRTRVNQTGSLTDLTFVLARPELARESSAALMHYAGLAEQRFRMENAILSQGAEWRHLDLKGRSRRHLPDAALRLTNGDEWGVEVDAGYPPATIQAKLKGMSTAGYKVVVWSTTVRSRVLSLRKTVARLDSEGYLPGLRNVVVYYVDFWSPGKPYGLRPYSDVPIFNRIELRRARARGSGGRVETQFSSVPDGPR